MFVNIRPILLVIVLTEFSVCKNDLGAVKGNSTMTVVNSSIRPDGSVISISRRVDDTTERIQFRKNETVTRTRFVPKVRDSRSDYTRYFANPRVQNKMTVNVHNKTMRPNNEKPLNYDYFCRKSLEKDDSPRMDNNTYVIKNGKKYKVIKVIRNDRCVNKRANNNQKTFQRRTFNNFNLNSVVPNFSSYFPIQWMTKKEGKNETETETPKNATEAPPGYRHWDFLSKWNPSSSTESRIKNYHGEKIKKLLNLFTIVKFDNGGCYASGLRGTCYHKIECDAKGGRAIGSCANGFGVCCYIQRTCGEVTRENCTYFVNEGFPQPSTAAPRICALTVNKAHPDVQQLRLEFQMFEIRGPNNGTCLNDRFTVTGHNANDVVPDICGINTGQHVYVDVDETNGPYSLNVITMGADFPRTFRIKVTQLKKDDELLAPKNCLQYYTEPTGTIQTFNYQFGNNGNPTEAVSGYFNNLNYVACIRKETGFCSVSYNNEERENSDPAFQLLNVDQDGERLIPPEQGGAEIFNCPDDYIIVNGLRLCGERLNDASVDLDYTKNYPVTDRSNGPFILPVKTNEAVTGRGFYLTYRQNPCLG